MPAIERAVLRSDDVVDVGAGLLAVDAAAQLRGRCLLLARGRAEGAPDGAVDCRSSVERRLDGGILASRPISAERRPSGRAAGDEAAEERDQGDRDELDAKAR